MSRRHAIFHCGEDGCYLEDAGSLNGTYVGEDRLVPHARHRVCDGQTVRMSDEEFVFEEGLALSAEEGKRYAV